MVSNRRRSVTVLWLHFMIFYKKKNKNSVLARKLCKECNKFSSKEREFYFREALKMVYEKYLGNE